MKDVECSESNVKSIFSFSDFYFSSYGHFYTQNMVSFWPIFTKTFSQKPIFTEKKSEYFVLSFSFVSERFSNIRTKKSQQLFLREEERSAFPKHLCSLKKRGMQK